MLQAKVLWTAYNCCHQVSPYMHPQDPHIERVTSVTWKGDRINYTPLWVCLFKGLSHGCNFHRRLVDLDNTSLYHYFKNHCRPYVLVVGDVGTGHRGTSVMTIWRYPRYCHIVIAHGPRWPVPTSPTISAIPSISHLDICGLCLLVPLVFHTQYINLPLAGSLGQHKMLTNSLGQLKIYISWLIGLA